MNWGLFLPWMTCWASTTLGCMGVGLWIGYGCGRDRAADDQLRQVEADLTERTGGQDVVTGADPLGIATCGHHLPARRHPAAPVTTSTTAAAR